MCTNWFSISGNLIRLICRNFTLAPVLIFAIFGECIVLYIKTTCDKLEAFITADTIIYQASSTTLQKEISKLLKILTSLVEIANEIKNRFEWMLLINLFQSAIMIITSSYYTIESIFYGYLVHVIWNVSDVLQFFFRI